MVKSQRGEKDERVAFGQQLRYAGIAALDTHLPRVGSMRGTAPLYRVMSSVRRRNLPGVCPRTVRSRYTGKYWCGHEWNIPPWTACFSRLGPQDVDFEWVLQSSLDSIRFSLSRGAFSKADRILEDEYIIDYYI